MKKIVLAAMLCLSSSNLLADDYHYREALIGERAAGLGGAYIAVADDPSGIWYNPAGIMFSFENYFSLSANVYNVTKEVFKGTIAGQDYTYSSSGLVPSFFGFTQNYGKSKWGFAIIVYNDDRIDQSDEITNISTGVGKPNTLSRKFYQQNTSTAVGVAWASELFKNFTWGLSTFGIYKSNRVIDNQLILYNADATNRQRFLISNANLDIGIVSLMPKLGFQWMPIKDFSLGGTLSKKLPISGNMKIKRYQSATTAAGTPADLTGTLSSDLPSSSSSTAIKDISPLELGLGLSYFPNPALLTSFDLVYYSSDNSSDFAAQSTINLSAGLEYFMSEQSALRLGFFTNNSNTPKLTQGSTDQRPHVDVYNLTLGYSLSSEGSTFSLGTSLGTGKGQGQAIGGSTEIQTIERTNMAFFLTGSYQM